MINAVTIAPMESEGADVGSSEALDEIKEEEGPRDDRAGESHARDKSMDELFGDKSSEGGEEESVGEDSDSPMGIEGANSRYDRIVKKKAQVVRDYH